MLQNVLLFIVSDILIIIIIMYFLHKKPAWPHYCSYWPLVRNFTTKSYSLPQTKMSATRYEESQII